MLKQQMQVAYIFIAMIVLSMVACTTDDVTVPERLPTQADPNAVGTAIIKTQNAPPPGFETVGYNPVDFNREALPGSFFEVTVNFEGQYTDTGESATGALTMQVWENGVLRTRRVTLRFLGEALSGTVSRVEAVRFENDYYILDESGICTKNDQVAEDIATLTAGRVVGGFTLALPTGRLDTINGLIGYQYQFAREDVVVGIFPTAPSVAEVISGEVWVNPDNDVVTRFGVVLNVHNARILFGEQPVTGTLRYEYNLLGIDLADPIALPNGC